MKARAPFAAMVGSICIGSAAPAATPQTGVAAAFTGTQLSALPRDAWLTNGGDQRAEWRAPLRRSGMSPRAGDPARGRDLYLGACVVCHGTNGRGGTNGRAVLTDQLQRDLIVNIVESGRNQMPAFGSALNAQQREDIAAYVLELVRTVARPVAPQRPAAR